MYKDVLMVRLIYVSLNIKIDALTLFGVMSFIQPVNLIFIYTSFKNLITFIMCSSFKQEI